MDREGQQLHNGGLGGAINEKEKQGRPPASLGFLLHSTFGLDHYPRYLHRWEAADLDRLEQGLALQLEAVREEKRSRRAQESALCSYVPKHPAIGGQGALMAALHPAVHAAIERGSKLALRALLREEAPGVYSLALLSPEFCQRVVEEVQHFAQWRTAAVEAGTTGAAAIPHRTTALAHAGLRGVALELLDRVIRPIAAVLFDDCGGGSLDWVQGFVAGYAAQPGGEARNLTRTSLVPHTDDSEVTLNVCLGREFRGGELVFRGLRGSEKEGQAERAVVLEAGRAVLHRGQHLHEVLPVKGGDRHAMILWCRSSRFRSSTCPCCVLHRREERCICGPFWN